MPDDWIVVQVGPVCRIPNLARYGVRRRWWYVYRRSRPVGSNTEREVDPWSADADPDWLATQKAMHRQARRLQMPWRSVRGGHKHDPTVAYYLTREEGERLKAFDSDRVEPVERGGGSGDAT
jgi:hypothetical protein